MIGRGAIMPTVLQVRERAAMPCHRWTVDEYHKMARAGLLDETDRVELIEGEMIDRAPIGSRHAYLVDKLAQILTRSCGPCLVRVQNPIVLGERSEPQPDIAVVRDKSYMEAHPTASDVLLIVEVSDTPLEYDRDIKLNLYASYGIPEVWLLDVNAGELAVYREPAAGQYRLMRKPLADEPVSPAALPGVSLSFAQIAA
jgi:Uma2 family endonuclease